MTNMPRRPMTNHANMRPDPMPLREALRGLRFMLRRGGETLADTISLDVLPKPAADLAGAVLREVGGIVRNMDEVASGLSKTVLAKTVLGPHVRPPMSLDDLDAQGGGEVHFAAAVYVALRTVLRRIGVPLVFVSEAAARGAWVPHQKPDAGTLTIRLLDARVVRGTTAADAARLPGGALDAVAVFAVLLWLQSTRSEDENEAALDAATDLAMALAADITAACAARDAVRIDALYARYAPHV